MKTPHLSDEQIQSYLDKTTLSDRDVVESHLNSCHMCQMNVKTYQEVYRTIETVQIPELSAEFINRVMSDIKKKIENKAQLKETLALIGLFLIGSAVSFYLVNPFTGLMNMLKSLFNGAIQFIEKLLPNFPGFTTIIIMVVLILIVIEVLDKKVLKTKI